MKYVTLDLTNETLDSALIKLLDGKQDGQDNGQDVMTMNDVAVVLGKTRKGAYKLIDNGAKQMAKTLGVKPLPVFKIPGSKEYGILRTDFFAWLKTLPAPIRIQKGRKKGKTR
jgi:hypothetical protein